MTTPWSRLDLAKAENDTLRARNAELEQQMTDIVATLQNLPDVTRFEVIDAGGRAYVANGITVLLALQDDGRTLKVFVR